MPSHRRLIPAAALIALSALPLPAYALSSHRNASAAAEQTTSTTTTTSQSTMTQSTTTAAATTQTSQAPPSTQAPTTTAGPVPTSQQSSAAGSNKGKTAGHDVVVPVGSSSLAHAAGDPGDTISDFKFSPAAITIHVGDTITWTNAGPTDHTATASDHSFDTGLLHKGQSGSHTFTQAGTFPYICTLHPFMHGTVVVESSSGGGGGGGGGGSGTPSGTPSSIATSTPNSTGSGSPGTTATTPVAASSTPTLPNTGTDLFSVVVVGALLIGAGIAIRRRLLAT
jgi:LPXTG-motif cell wall-anchored protein